MAATMAAVLLVTFATGAFFYANVAGQLTAGADADVADHVEDGASIASLWAETNGNLAERVADSSAIESGDTGAATDYLRSTASESGAGVHAIHYVDSGSGEVLASSRDSAVGRSLDVDATSDASPGEPRAAVGSDARVAPFVARVGDGRAVVVAASTAHLHDRLAESPYSTTVASGETVLLGSGGNVTERDEAAAALFADSGERTTTTFGTGTDHVVTGASVAGTDWAVVTHAPSGAVYGERTTATAAIVALLFVVFVNLGLVGITIGGNLALSLRQLTERAGEIADGDLTVELETDRTDEVGALYEEFDTMRVSLRESLAEAESAREEAETARAEAEAAREEAEELNQQLVAEAERYSEIMDACADGDLTRRLDPETDSEAMEAIAASFNEMIADLQGTIADVQSFADAVARASREVETSADEVREASDEVSGSVQRISTGAREQTEDLQETADEVNDLSASVEEIAATTDEVAAQFDRVADRGAEGRRTAEATIEEMRAIEETTREVVSSIEQLDDEVAEIGEVVQLIDDIAEQTNVLALNASIEAARADTGGGDGFTVVADEVKALAEQTQEAVGEIREIVTSVQSQTTESAAEIREAESRIVDGTTSVEQLAEALEAIVDGVEGVDTGLQDINRTTDEQAQSAQAIVAMVDDVADVSEETSRRAETVATTSEAAASSITEAAQSAADLATQAQELDDALSAFRIDRKATAAADGGQADPGFEDAPVDDEHERAEDDPVTDGHERTDSDPDGGGYEQADDTGGETEWR